MSDQTYAALENALRVHVIDEDNGAYLSAWYIVAAAAMPDDPHATAYRYVTSDSPPHLWLGLLEMAKARAMGLIGDDDEDD